MSDKKRYAYHCTSVDPEIIKKNGWKSGEGGFTSNNMFEDLYENYLPEVPVFVSDEKVKVWSNKSKYCIKLDITGLDLYPDFGSLPDVGAHYDFDSELFWWESKNDIKSKEMKEFVRVFGADDSSFYACDFSGEDSMENLGTACVSGKDLTPDRIVAVMKRNKNNK